MGRNEFTESAFVDLDRIEASMESLTEIAGPEAKQHVEKVSALLKSIRVELWRIDGALFREEKGR